MNDGRDPATAEAAAGADALAPVRLDGESLTVADLVRVARDPRIAVELDPEAVERVRRGRRQIDRIVEAYTAACAAAAAGEPGRPVQDYGITTGFGEFKDIPLPPDRLEEVQRNLLLSHASGIGETADADDPANYLSAAAVRATLMLRVNTFLKGHSGVRVELIETLLGMLASGVVPLVPIKGSMGSSGDLCPLAHLFATLLGEGRFYVVREPADLAYRERRLEPATRLGAYVSDPVLPSVKEGLALSNGATVSTALLALALHDAEVAADVADVAAALTLEAICGCARAFDPKVHAARGHAGQIASAARIRRLVAGSTLVDGAGAVQDPYSVRCAPVVHGASRDAMAYVRTVVEREMNAATDNPLFFPEAAEPWDVAFAANWPPGYDGRRRASYSAGNFHGEPIAMAADVLAIAAAELANVAERRTQMLLDRHHNRNLPANLVSHRGVNSGYMLSQYAAASLVAENKILAHPASVDSIPTGANVEDHVAVATTAARKVTTVVGNVHAVLAVELTVAAQAVDWRVGMALPPFEPLHADDPERDTEETPAGPYAAWAEADAEARRFAAAVADERRDAIAARLGNGTAAAYRTVRRVVPPLVADRVLADDLRRVRGLVASGELATLVAGAVGG